MDGATNLVNVTLTAPNTFTTQVAGNYFVIAQVSPLAAQVGPTNINIQSNGVNIGGGTNNGTATGQEVVAMGVTGQIPAGTAITLNNASGQSIAYTQARLIIFRMN
ncbi:hypothetical protein NST39_04220 [Bacillus sp. FSL W8-0645]|uniref:hypothetical protein n=1 Tax=Bacillus sp. FSL W8-0645 TaxID=2954627 RepID=UPI0030F88D7A